MSTHDAFLRHLLGAVDRVLVWAVLSVVLSALTWTAAWERGLGLSALDGWRVLGLALLGREADRTGLTLLMLCALVGVMGATLVGGWLFCRWQRRAELGGHILRLVHRRGRDLVGIDDVPPLTDELMVERFDNSAQEGVAGTLSLVLIRIEVEAAAKKEALQSWEDVQAPPLRQHSPEFCPLCSELFAEFIELGVVEASLATTVIVPQHLAHPELGDRMQLLVIELGYALGALGSPAQLQFLALLLELDVDARVLRSRKFLGCATVGRAKAADDMLLLGGISCADGGRDSASHVQVAVLTACINIFRNHFQSLLHKGLCDRPCSNRLFSLKQKGLDF